MLLLIALFYLITVIVAFGINYWYYQVINYSTLVTATVTIKENLNNPKFTENLTREAIDKLEDMSVLPIQEQYENFINKCGAVDILFITGLPDIYYKVKNLREINIPVRWERKTQDVNKLALLIQKSAEKGIEK